MPHTKVPMLEARLAEQVRKMESQASPHLRISEFHEKPLAFRGQELAKGFLQLSSRRPAPARGSKCRNIS